MTSITPVGSVSPGTLFLDGQGIFRTVSSSSSNQMLISGLDADGPTILSISSDNLRRGGFSGGVRSFSILQSNSTAAYPQLSTIPAGDNTSSYSAAAQVFSGEVYFSGGNTLVIDTAITCSVNGGSIYVNAYVNYDTTPLMFLSGNFVASSSGIDMVSTVNSRVQVNDFGFIGVFPVAVCVFASGGTGAAALDQSDFLCVREVGAQTQPTLSQTVSLVNNVTVTVLSLGIANNTSVGIQGVIFFADADFSDSNSQNVFIVVERGGGNATVSVAPVFSISAAPYFEAIISGGDTLEIQAVGVASKTYTVTLQYTQVNEGF